MEAKEGDAVRVKHKGAELSGIIVRRMGLRLRVQLHEGASVWREVHELLPTVAAEESEVADLQRCMEGEAAVIVCV